MCARFWSIGRVEKRKMNGIEQYNWTNWINVRTRFSTVYTPYINNILNNVWLNTSFIDRFEWSKRIAKSLPLWLYESNFISVKYLTNKQGCWNTFCLVANITRTWRQKKHVKFCMFSTQQWTYYKNNYTWLYK